MINWIRGIVVQWLGMTESKPVGPDDNVGNQAGDWPFHTRRPFHFLSREEVVAATHAARSDAISLCWYDNYDNVEIPCRSCRRPVLLRRGGGEWDSLVGSSVLHSCPACGSSIAYVFFPNQSEATVARDDDVAAQCERREARRVEFQRHCLKRPDQLPNVDAGQFALEWDIIEEPGKESWTVICLNGDEIFREFAFWENGERYGQVAAILKAKYGARMTDLVPTYAGWIWLGGDSLSSLAEARNARKGIFGVDATGNPSDSCRGTDEQ